MLAPRLSLRLPGVGRRGGVTAAAAAGALAGLASMIRPNLQPLAIVPCAQLLLSGGLWPLRQLRWRHACVFVCLALVGQFVNAWSQYVLYGNAFRPGYAGWETFFQLAHAGINVRTYPRLFLEVFGPLPLVAVACAVAPARILSPPSRSFALSLAGIVALNVALYLFYLPYDQWTFLRFFLPSIVVLEAMFSAVLVAAIRHARRRVRILAMMCVVLAVVGVVWRGRDKVAFALDEWEHHARIPAMGHYLREALPRNAVVLSYLHGGSVAYYTGHNVLSLEVMPPQRLEPLIKELELSGCSPVLVVDAAGEEQEFRRTFGNAGYAALDWPARAEFGSSSRIRYFVASDRQRYLNGQRWVTDVLR